MRVCSHYLRYSPYELPRQVWAHLLSYFEAKFLAKNTTPRNTVPALIRFEVNLDKGGCCGEIGMMPAH